MIHWGWAVGAFVIGGVAGIIGMACLAIGASEHSYRCGYNEGREDGFQAGLNKEKEIKNV